MMDKLISQQAAINAVSEITTTMSVCTNKDECYGMKRMQKQAITELANLPSAESCGNVVSRNAIIQKLNQMDRYVSAELRLCDTDKKFPQNEVFIVDDVYEEIVEQLPSAQSEHRDALEKAVAVEAISDELMLRFDISVTYAYEVAEAAVNRIEVMAKEMGKR